jgi:hypothetical protein
MSEHYEPVYEPSQEPGYAAEYSTAAPGGQSQYRILKPSVAASIDIRKPQYDRRSLGATVFRPFPCRSFSKPNEEFEPYRKDVGGNNFFGYWIRQLQVAWNIGNPATTFIVQPPDNSGVAFDQRTTPLSVLYRAINNAVKRGQGRGDNWASATRAFNPSAEMVLRWSGALDGEQDKGKSLSWPQTIYAMQGFIPVLGGKYLGDQPGGMPGWHGDKPCVFLVTAGVGKTLLEAFNAETPGFRGDPADFESRYVNGDPVSVNSGRWIVVYPKGGDPRTKLQRSNPAFSGIPMSPATFSAGAAPAAAKGGKDKDEIGFDAHIEKISSVDGLIGMPANLSDPATIKMVRRKWRHWNDILHFPSDIEQAQILASIFPAAMLVYAFEGEHPQWLTDDVRKRAAIELGAQLPNASAPYGARPLPAGLPGYGQPMAGAMPQAGFNPAVAGQPAAGFPVQPGFHPASGFNPAAGFNPTIFNPSTSSPLSYGQGAMSMPGAPTAAPELPASMASFGVPGQAAPVAESSAAPVSQPQVSQPAGMVSFPPVQEQPSNEPVGSPVWDASLDKSIVAQPGSLDATLASVPAASGGAMSASELAQRILMAGANKQS